MVRVLISLRATVGRHQLARASRVPLLLGLAVGLVSAGGTCALGFAEHARAAATGDVVAAVFALWMAGQVAQAAFSGGEATLRPQLFALLPLDTRRLAWSLLCVAMLDPALVFVLIAYTALLPVGARAAGADGAAVAAAGTVLTLLATAVLATVAGGVLGPAARRSRDVGTITAALALSLLALTGTLLPAVVGALEDGSPVWLRRAVHCLPSGWGVDAVRAEGAGHLGAAVGWLTGLLLLSLVGVLAWPAALRRRMSAGPRTGRGPSGADSAVWSRIRPSTPIGAVCAKELRLWVRDPIRITFLLIAAVVGAGVAVIARWTAGTGLLMPFAGPLTVVIAGACACNLYGNDGTSLWVTMTTPGAVAPDVRGRQYAWAILVVPFAAIETVLLTALSGESRLWPWGLALVLALSGGAAGVLPVGSLVGVQPLDEAGNPTPAWSVKIHIALLAVACTAAPAAAALVLGAVTGDAAVTWSALPVAALTSAVLVRWGRGSATRRLAAEQTTMLARLTPPPDGRRPTPAA